MDIRGASLWGREIAYTDMMRFLDGCDWVQEYASFFSSEDMDRIEGYDVSEIGTIYERKGSD